jgi:hypothetical protein
VSEPAHNSQAIHRPERFTSHTLVEIRRFKSLPFLVQSAVLLDISLGGFKAEFTGESKTKKGQIFWISIPLTPLGIYAPSRLVILSQCRWFDLDHYRLGGVFVELEKSDKIILEQVIETIQSQSLRSV